MRPMQALVGASQFDVVLGSRKRIANNSLSPHFSLHYAIHPSTDVQPHVDTGVRLGFIIAKKQSKQASRRNLIRRIWKAAIEAAQADKLPFNIDMVVRLRAPFDKTKFTSASSPQLKQQIRQEAQALLMQWRAQAIQDTPRAAT